MVLSTEPLEDISNITKYLLGTMTDGGERRFRRSKSLNLTIFIGLEATVCMCLILGTHVVSTDSERKSLEPILAAIQYLCEIAMIINVFMLVRYIRKKEKFHLDQTVFWPTRCYHCARMLNLEGTLLPTDQENQPGSDSDNEGVTNPDSNGLCSNLLQEAVACNASGSNPHCLISISRMNDGNSQESFKGNTKNRALINVFRVFCVVSGAGLFVETIRKFLCYAHGDYSTTTIIAYSVTNFVIICTLPIILSFVNAYTDAVFLDSYQNLLTSTLILFVSIWQCATRTSEPIGKFLRVRHEDDNVTVHSTCDMNNTIKYVFDYIDRTVSPIYTETSITLLGISLQIWN